MTEIYQPVIFRELLSHGGRCTKDQLAWAIAKYDLSLLEYYRRIVMRWPKITLTKHGIVHYDRKTKTLSLKEGIFKQHEVEEAQRLCDVAIAQWLKRKAEVERSPAVNESVR